MIRVLKAKKEDFKDFIRLHNDFIRAYKKLSRYRIRKLSQEKLKTEFASRFGKDKLFHFARKDSTAVGYIFGYVERNTYGDYGYIDEIFVTKPYQGKGVSTKLKNQILKDLKKKGLKYCRIDVNPENKKAIHRYEQWGFKVDKLRMTKTI